MKIGFLAMSGIRAHDPELLALGLTLPGFVERSKAVASLPSLGLLYLAAVTPEGHELRYFEAESDRSEPPEVYGCDLVAISTFSAQVGEAYAIADRLRARGVLVAMGGLHVTVRPDEARRHADFVIIGEGEGVWPEVVALAGQRGGRLEESVVIDARARGPVDVATLPVPRYDLIAGRPYNRFTVQTSRGCPWRCEFCASSVMLQHRYRKRPVEHIVRDVKAVLQVRKHAFIEFADDNTFVDKAWSKDLCRALMPLHIKWFAETDASVADDDELLALLRQAGCRQVLIGLESTTRPAVEGLELHANAKVRWADTYGERIRKIQSAGIAVNACFILGLDTQGPEIFDQVAAFAEQYAPYDVQITILTPFPGTPLYDRLDREGRLLQKDRWDLCTLFDINFQPRHMSVETLRAGIHDLTRRLYNDTATRARRDRFWEGVRHRDRTLKPLPQPAQPVGL
jgi:radical SAM superfamily enzyme YgiQ (UPF0313 family)